MTTPKFKFLDIINYVAPETSCDKWVKTFGAKQTKSFFPYDWFDSAEKLDYPEPAVQEVVYKSQKRDSNCCVL